mmetsp:Transcript_114202/g.243570  ORF Transcript_114202/g.243570 Transcript_114202/m.243570 type:complete len:213 (-) Transcript_114202:458-1096(-)
MGRRRRSARRHSFPAVCPCRSTQQTGHRHWKYLLPAPPPTPATPAPNPREQAATSATMSMTWRPGPPSTATQRRSPARTLSLLSLQGSSSPAPMPRLHCDPRAASECQLLPCRWMCPRQRKAPAGPYSRCPPSVHLAHRPLAQGAARPHAALPKRPQEGAGPFYTGSLAWQRTRPHGTVPEPQRATQCHTWPGLQARQSTPSAMPPCTCCEL